MTGAVHSLLSALCAGKGPDDRVFTRQDGRPVRDFRSAWRNLCVRAAAPGPDGKPSRFECAKCGAPMATGKSRCRAKTEDSPLGVCGGPARYVSA